jgi:hypothetical protein
LGVLLSAAAAPPSPEPVPAAARLVLLPRALLALADLGDLVTTSSSLQSIKIKRRPTQSEVMPPVMAVEQLA